MVYLKSLIVICVIWSIFLIYVSAEDNREAKRNIFKRGITEWRFKRVRDDAVDLIENFDVVLQLKPKENSELGKISRKPAFYKVKLIPEHHLGYDDKTEDLNGYD